MLTSLSTNYYSSDPDSNFTIKMEQKILLGVGILVGIFFCVQALLVSKLKSQSVHGQYFFFTLNFNF